MIVARIVIERDLTEDGDRISATAADEAGGDLALVDALGLLRFAEDSLIRDRMGQASDG